MVVIRVIRIITETYSRYQGLVEMASVRESGVTAAFDSMLYD